MEEISISLGQNIETLCKFMSSSTMKNICEVCGGICNAKDSVCCSICDNISSHIFCTDTPSLIPKSWKCEDCAQATVDHGKKRRGTRLIDCETARKSLDKSRSLVIKTAHVSSTNNLKGNASSSARDKEKALNFPNHNSQRNPKEYETSFHEKNIAKSVVPHDPIVKFDHREEKNKKSGRDGDVIPSRRQNTKAITSLKENDSHIRTSFKGYTPSSSTDKEKALSTSIRNSQKNLKEYKTGFHEKNTAKSVAEGHPIVKFDSRAVNSKKSVCDNDVILSRGQNMKSTTSLKDDECEKTNPPQKLLIITEGTLPHQPVPCANWKGDFQITDISTELCFDILEIQAHIPGTVCQKVQDSIKKLVGKDIELKLLPRYKTWPKIFVLEPPQLNDIGLYFFPSKEERLRRAFTRCVDLMDKKDFAMIGSVSSDAKLLIFSSVQLPQDPYAAGITTDICMWGVFKYRKHKKQTASSGNKALLLDYSNSKGLQKFNAERSFRQKENEAYDSREIQEYQVYNDRPGITFKPVILKKSTNNASSRGMKLNNGTKRN